MTNSLGEPPELWRANFAEAAEWYVGLATEAPGKLDAAGLGEWTVRELIGHTSRALMTPVQYLGADGPITIPTLAAYYATPWDNTAVLERGRAAGDAVGDDPAAFATSVAKTALDTVDAAPDDALLGTIAGVMALGEYLPTRTLELVVHTCDLAVAIGAPPIPPRGPALSVYTILGQVSGDRLGTALLALTGRPVAPQFTLLH